MNKAVDDRILRSVNYRIKTTPVHRLPKILPLITGQLASAETDLGNHPEATWLKTRISSLLQDRSREGRWGGVVLAKTVLEALRPDALFEDKERMSSWARGLIDVLRKAGPETTKSCAILVVTRLFMLTWEHATLVREITTPVLPTFVTACLQHFPGASLKSYSHSRLIESVLESFAALIARHHTIFRSFASQIRSLALAVLSCHSFDGDCAVVTADVKALASRALILLHQCAQKGGAATEWQASINELVISIHCTTDQVFRAVSEDWQSVTSIRTSIQSASELTPQPQSDADKSSGFHAWQGLGAGAEQLKSQLMLLAAYLNTPCATSVKIPIGRIVDLVTRLLSVQAPRSHTGAGNRYNTQIGREEREELLALLPDIHVSTVRLMSAMIDCLGQSSAPLSGPLLELITWLFETEGYDTNIRSACYRCSGQILMVSGLTMSKATVKTLERIVKGCCKDLMPDGTESKSTVTGCWQNMNGTKLTTGPAAGDGTPAKALTAVTSKRHPELHGEASELLPLLFMKLPVPLIPSDTRTRMDRVAVLASHTEALTASVLNPAPQKASLLPFLSASSPESLFAEALLRPRMPVIVSGTIESAHAEDGMTEDDGAQGDEDAVLNGENGKPEQPETESWTTRMQTRLQSTPLVKIRDFGASVSTEAIGKVDEAESAMSGALRTVKRQADAVAAEMEATSKKVRLDQAEPGLATELSMAESMVPRGTEIVQVEAPAEFLRHAVAADDSDDDGSEFEIPKLVMRGDSDVEDDERSEAENEGDGSEVEADVRSEP